MDYEGIHKFIWVFPGNQWLYFEAEFHSMWVTVLRVWRRFGPENEKQAEQHLADLVQEMRISGRVIYRIQNGEMVPI